MTAFKQQLAADVDAVWFNNDEFCDYHKINGVEMHVLIDSYELEKRKSAASEHATGIYTDQLIIFVPASEFGPKPRIGVNILLDDRKNYRVLDVQTEDGVYCMELEAAR